MISLRRGVLGDERGTAAIEFAIIGMPVVMLFLFIFAGALLLWSKCALNAAAMQTARCVAINSLDCSDTTGYATTLLSNWGVGNIVPDTTVSVQTGQLCGLSAGHYAMVTLTTTPKSMSSLIPQLSGLTISVTACYPSST